MATQTPYLLVSAAVAAVALAVHFTAFPAYGDDAATDAASEAVVTAAAAPAAMAATSVGDQMGAWLQQNRELLSGNRRFRNGVLAQFAYVGAQIGVWSYLIQYMQHNVEDRSEKIAADHVFYSLLMLTIGRAVSTVLLRTIPSWKLASHSHEQPQSQLACVMLYSVGRGVRYIGGND